VSKWANRFFLQVCRSSRQYALIYADFTPVFGRKLAASAFKIPLRRCKVKRIISLISIYYLRYFTMILAVLGVIVTILILLNRLANEGIDLGGFNPFLWKRRRNWRNKLEGNPIYQIESPMDAIALYMVAIVKADGDMTKEDKTHLLSLFVERFNLSNKEASNLLVSSSHLLGNGEEAQDNVAKVIEKSLALFSDEQITSSKALLREVAGDLEQRPKEVQQLIRDLDKVFSSTDKTQNW